MHTLEKQYLDDNCLLREKDSGVESTLPILSPVVNHDYLSRMDFLEVGDGKSPVPLKANVWDAVLPGCEFSDLEETNRPIEEGLSEGGKIISGGYVGTGAKWESYLHSEYRQIMGMGCFQHAPSCEDDEEDEEIPLSVSIKLWIDEEILYQYPH